MKHLVVSLVLVTLFGNGSMAQCKNLNFQEIYSLWTAYHNRTFENAIVAKGGEKFDKGIYGICYSLIEGSKEDSIYNYNELFQVDDIVRFTYATLNKDAYQQLKKSVLELYDYIGFYVDKGVRFNVYYNSIYKYCCLSEVNSGISPNREIILYDLEFDNFKPPYVLQ